jgi:UDP-glucose 4-epimerase
LNLDKVREGSAGSWVCDTSRAQQQLGFNTRHNLATRIEQTTDAYKTAGWL